MRSSLLLANCIKYHRMLIAMRMYYSIIDSAGLLSLYQIYERLPQSGASSRFALSHEAVLLLALYETRSRRQLEQRKKPTELSTSPNTIAITALEIAKVVQRTRRQTSSAFLSICSEMTSRRVQLQSLLYYV